MNTRGGVVSIEIRGLNEVQKLARDLAAASRRLMPDLADAAADSLKPLEPTIRRSAMDTLPTRGGLDRKIAASEIRIIKRRNVVRLEVRNAYALRSLDDGVLRHPVFGNRKKWVSQRVRPGWWTRPVTTAKPRIGREVQAKMQRIISRIGGV